MSYQGPASHGMMAAHVIAASNGVNPYKPKEFLSDDQWWGNKAQAPVKTDWNAPDYQNFKYQKYDAGGPDPSYKTYGQAAPQYKGFEGGDYDRYELNLRAPGEQAASRAYQSAKRDLADAYSSRGMYGSSQFTRQMDGQVNRSYMDALSNNAAGAATRRYDFQAQDMRYASQQAMQEWNARMQENQASNQMGYNVWANRLGENQNMNALMFQDNAAQNNWNWRSSVSQRDWNDFQDMRQINYNNQMAQERQNWDMSRLQWDTQQNDAVWNRTWNIWKNYDPENERFEKKILKKQATAGDKKSTGMGSGIGSLIGTVGGGLIGGYFGGPVGAQIGSSLGGGLGSGIGEFAETGQSEGLIRGMLPNASSMGSGAGKLGSILGSSGSMFG